MYLHGAAISIVSGRLGTIDRTTGTMAADAIDRARRRDSVLPGGSRESRLRGLHPVGTRQANTGGVALDCADVVVIDHLRGRNVKRRREHLDHADKNVEFY
jgi:hypothetical protein